MKIFHVLRPSEIWPDSAENALKKAEAPDPQCFPVALLPDSALSRDNKPMFIPDFAQNGWIVEIMPAIHICRLGKFIDPKFANRYFATASLAARLIPEADHNGKHSILSATPLASLFDGAITIGQQYPFQTGTDLHISLEGVGQTIIPYNNLHIEQTIALLSRFSTLKMADIIIPCATPLALPARIDSTVEATLNNRPALRFRMK